MAILVTGSTGHLGEALVRVLTARGYEAFGLDIKGGGATHHVGSITDRAFVQSCFDGISVVFHAAAMHKPHVATHPKQTFVDVNVSGTLNLLEEAAANHVKAFIFTSTTSAFGKALTPSGDAPAAWIDETVPSIPKNIYGVTKTAAEDLCRFFHLDRGLNCLILRTSRFFLEEDDNKAMRDSYADENIKANEFLFRRVDLEDAVSAHLAAMDRASAIGFGRYVISATTPFRREDVQALRHNADLVVDQRMPGYRYVYQARGYQMFPSIDRVYANDKARADLGWEPRFDFAHILEQMASDAPIGSDLGREVGMKGYHDEVFDDGPYPAG